MADEPNEKILGLIAGIACIVAVVAVQDDVTTRKSRDRYKEWGESVKGLLWYVPNEQWGTYAKERLKKDGNKPYDTNDADDPLFARPTSVPPPGPWQSTSPPSH